MKILQIITLATCLTHCNAVFSTTLTDKRVGVGSEVQFQCLLAQNKSLQELIVWSVNGVMQQPQGSDGIFIIESADEVLNNSRISCTFFTTYHQTAVLCLIGQSDMPVLNIVTVYQNSVLLKIDPGNTRGSAISAIRVSLPDRIYNFDVIPETWVSFNYAISGLGSGIAYRVRISCWNGYKWSKWGTVQVLTLASDIKQTTTTTIFNPTILDPTSNADRTFVNFPILILLIYIILS